MIARQFSRAEKQFSQAEKKSNVPRNIALFLGKTAEIALKNLGKTANSFNFTLEKRQKTPIFALEKRQIFFYIHWK